jgi:hypothetical protein
MNKPAWLKLTLLLTAFSFALHLMTIDTLACSCVKGLTIKEEFERTDFVFIGDVIEITPGSQARVVLPIGLSSKSEWRLDNYEVLIVTFQVSEWLKGDGQSTCQTITAPHTAACGYPFKVGQRYLVYADNWKKEAEESDTPEVVRQELVRIPAVLKQQEEKYNEPLPELGTSICKRTSGIDSKRAQEDLEIIQAIKKQHK